LREELSGVEWADVSLENILGLEDYPDIDPHFLLEVWRIYMLEMSVTTTTKTTQLTTPAMSLLPIFSHRFGHAVLAVLESLPGIVPHDDYNSMGDWSSRKSLYFWNDRPIRLRFSISRNRGNDEGYFNIELWAKWDPSLTSRISMKGLGLQLYPCGNRVFFEDEYTIINGDYSAFADYIHKDELVKHYNANGKIVLYVFYK
jgi:hypothetical protein